MIADIVARLRARRQGPWVVSFETPVLDRLVLPDGSPAPVVDSCDELAAMPAGRRVVDRYGSQREKLDDGLWQREDGVRCEARLLWTLRPLHLVGEQAAGAGPAWHPTGVPRPDEGSA